MAMDGFDWKPDYMTVFHLVPAKEDAPEEGCLLYTSPSPRD